MLDTWTRDGPGIGGFLLWQQGQLDPVLLLGQELPGRGEFKGSAVDAFSPNGVRGSADYRPFRSVLIRQGGDTGPRPAAQAPAAALLAARPMPMDPKPG